MSTSARTERALVYHYTGGKSMKTREVAPFGSRECTRISRFPQTWIVMVGLLLAPFATTAAAGSNNIWTPITVPGTIDAGPDSAVELGVKFKSDLDGFITGIRFYKAGANTGTHVGNLWTNTGRLLASATFTNESASGWQQVDFSTPVAIAAGVVYVASYHTNVGHYSFDSQYFANIGVDNPPLHALQNGISGGDGVFAYGSISLFPANSFNSANYWVDVAFTASSGPLVSIAVAISSPTLLAGTTQHFTATGNYSDGSTADLTQQASWASSNPAIATI
ncbi:MAG TPA: DUF4082 domain-containing protein, partial [Terriglobales bacterium]|nr:DUF4082 domain-containing protein [Terriglobales bacterium]